MRYRSKHIVFFDLIAFMVFSAFNGIFFGVYQQALGLPFSLTLLGFVVSFSLSTILLLRIFHHIGGRLIAIGLYGILLLYSLVNFAYFKVFQKYWRINWAQLRELKWSMVDLIIDFYVLIPWFVYGLAFLFFSLLVFGVYLYVHYDRKRSLNIVELRYGDELSVETKASYGWVVIASCFVFLFLNNLVLGTFLHSYVSESAHGDFSEDQFYADIGPYGYLLYIAFDNKEALQASASELLQEQEEDKTDFQIIRDQLQELSQLQGVQVINDHFDFEQQDQLPNIVIYQMESVDSWALKESPSPMPYLESLQMNDVSVDQFYSNSCTTINAEFSTLCSFFSDSYGPISDLYADNDYQCLPSVLSERYGYNSIYYHANLADFWNRDKLGPAWGFNEMKFQPYYRHRLSDETVLGGVVSDLKEATQPTFSYVVGFTSHGPHDQNFIDFNNKENGLDIKPYGNSLSVNVADIEVDEQTTRNYLGFLTAIDNGIASFYDEMERNGLLDNTIIIIFGDHRYYNFESSNKLRDFNNYNQIPFAMHLPDGQTGQPQNIASNIDIAPTILHILEGDDFSMPDSYVGTSIFDENHPGNVVCKCLGEASYIDGDTVVQGNVSFNNYKPITAVNQDFMKDLTSYTQPLITLLALSDTMLADNRLAGNEDILVEAATTEGREEAVEVGAGVDEQVLKTIDLDQVTDTDGDGLSDLREKAMGTDRFNPDTDGDGFMDGVEVVNGYNPLGEGRL